MRNITRHVVASNVELKTFSDDSVEIKRVLITRPNHRLGNLLLITPIIQEIIKTFPNCKIDLFVKGNLAPAILKNYENIDTIIQLPKKPFKHLTKYIQGWLSIKKHRYDLVINVVHNSSSGRLSTQFANARYKFFGEIKPANSKCDDKHIAKYPIYNLRHYLTTLGLKENDRPIESLNLKLNSAEIAEGEKILKRLVHNNKKTISLYTYATGDKCYSELWWEKFYALIKAEYPEHNVIEVLPIENISRLSFKAPTFYSTDIREIGSLIANTELFISADCGIMHLANAVQTPTIGFFSITDPGVYQPYNNNSGGINTNLHTHEECIIRLREIIRTTPVQNEKIRAEAPAIL